jgi:dTDP-4-amino-4,6-dideoxygalactose transaminase
MLRAAGAEGGDVIVPSFTFAATPHAVHWAGAQPIFADVDASMRLDPTDVEARVTEKTKAILAVDPYGIACDYDALHEVCRAKGLKFLVDSAAAFGTRYQGRLVGGFGDAQIFSFHATKAFNTMEGGCLCSHDTELLDRARAIRNFGQDASGDCAEPGLNGKMMEICALIGLQQLETFEESARIRRSAVQRLRNGLHDVSGVTVARAPEGQDPIWLYLPLIVDSGSFGMDRDALADALAKENLLVRRYYSPPCHLMSAYSVSAERNLPVTESLAANVLALPIYNNMEEWECDGIVEAVLRVQQQARH